jgi:hypothetical protein
MKLRPTLALLLLACSSAMFGQLQTDPSLSARFDTAVGRENLGFNNGTIHFNPYRSADKTHRYFGPDQYQAGEISYDGQTYSDIPLRYDLLDDAVVAKMSKGNMGFNLIRQKTESFTLGGKKFVNLDLANSNTGFASGFYEEAYAGNGVVLYIKHSKERIEVLTNERVFNKYIEKNEFIVHHLDSWSEANSQKDWTLAFPKLKDKIDEFYRTNNSSRTLDTQAFMKNLAALVNKSLSDTSNR